MKEIDYTLLAKVLSGEASSQEKEALQSQIEESKENQELFEKYKYFYQQTAISENVQASSLQKYEKPKNSIRYIIAVAASVAIIMALTYVFSNLVAPQDKEPVIAERVIVTKSNPKGQKSKIMLPDGSVVWLNSDSQLRYHENFTDSSRIVKLTGEAYFEVVKDSSRPFVVKVNDLQTTVLGTSFNISAFPDMENIIVSLMSGKLQVTVAENEALLQPGEQVKHNGGEGAFTKQKVDTEKIALWKDGVLAFEKEKFAMVIYRLERWYGVDIDIQGEPSSQWRFSGYFENENLKNVLEVLSFGKNVNFEIDGKNVKMHVK